MNAEQVAKLFHETYERLAPAFGYVTRKSSRLKWDSVPQKNRALMVAVSQTVLNALLEAESAEKSDNKSSIKFPELEEVIELVARDRPGRFYVMTGHDEKLITKVFDIIVGNKKR